MSDLRHSGGYAGNCTACDYGLPAVIVTDQPRCGHCAVEQIAKLQRDHLCTKCGYSMIALPSERSAVVQFLHKFAEMDPSERLELVGNLGTVYTAEDVLDAAAELIERGVHLK